MNRVYLAVGFPTPFWFGVGTPEILGSEVCRGLEDGSGAQRYFSSQNRVPLKGLYDAYQKSSFLSRAAVLGRGLCCSFRIPGAGAWDSLSFARLQGLGVRYTSAFR